MVICDTDILCIIFKIITFFITMLFARHVDHKWTLLHDSIISLRKVVWARKTSLTLQLFIEVPGDFSLYVFTFNYDT
jgi:hypothetical protein